MAEELLTGQPTPPTGPLPLTYQNLFTESTKVSQRKDVPLPNGKYATNAKELETYLQTPENQDAYYKMYSAPAMAFGARNLESFKTKLAGGLTSGEIAIQKAKPSLPTVKPQTQVQQMEYQALNQPAIDQFNELKANKINKTAEGKTLNTYTEMQDYFSKPENVSEWGKAYNYSLKTKGFDLNQIANNAKPVQSLKTVTEIQTDNVTKRIEEDLSQVDPKKLAELVYNAEELGIVGESIELQKPIEIAEIQNGELVVTAIKNLTYDRYKDILKRKYGKTDVDTSLIEPSVSGDFLQGQPLVYDETELGKELNKTKENYLDVEAEKIQNENRSKIKNYDADVETKMRQLLSPEDQKLAQITDQIESLTNQMLMDKYSGKGVAPDFQAKLKNLEQQAAQTRKDMGLASEQMFDSVTGQMVDTTPEEKQAIQIGAQKASEKYSVKSPKDQLKAERNLLWEKIQLVDQQLNSVTNEWNNEQNPTTNAIGLGLDAIGVEGVVAGKATKLFNTAQNLRNKKAELYGQMLTLNKLLYTNEDVFKRETEYGFKAAAESVVEKGYGFSLFSDQNTIRTRVQEVEEAKKFFEERGIQLSNKQLLGAETGLGEAVGAGIGPTLNGIIDIGVTSYGLGALTKGLTGSKYWQVTKEFMSNKYGAAGRFATSMAEGSLPYLIQGEAYSLAGQSFGTGVAEKVAEKGFDKYAAQGLEKLGGKYGKLTFILGRWLSGASGEFVAEVVGNIAPLLAENGFDVNKAYEDAFGKTSDERTKNLAILGMSVTLLASPANLAYAFKTKQEIKQYIAENGSNPVLEETLRVIDDTIERMPQGEAATRLDERIYGDNPVEPLVFTEAPSTIINEDAIEPPVQGPVERPLETVEVEKRSANNGEEFFVVENDGKVNKNVLYRVNETNGQLEVKGYDAMQEGWVPASKTITDAVDRKSKENGIISSDKATRVAKQRLNIDPDAERVITKEGKVLYQTPGQSAAQFGRNRQRNTNTVRATADNTFAFLNGVKEKIISTVFPNTETKVDEQQSASYNTYRDAVRTKMKLNAGSFFSRGKAVLVESGMNKIPKVADFLAALVEDFGKTGRSIEITVDNIAQATTKTALKIEDVVNSIIATEFFQDKFGSMAEASDYAKNLLTDLMINDKSVAQEIFGQNKEAYNQFIKFREGFNKYVAKNYTGSIGFSNDHKFYNNQMPDMAIKAREEEFQMEEKQRVEERAKREDVANVLNLAGVETSTQNVEGVRYKQGEISAQQYLDTLGEDINGLTQEEITAKADVAAEGVNIDTFNQAVANRITNEQTRKKRETRLRKELRTKFGFNNPLAKLIAKGALPDMTMRSKRAVTATMMNKVIETAATRAGVTADEFLDNYLQFQKSTEQEFMDFVKNQPGGKELYQRIGEMGAQYSQQVNDFLNTAKALEKQGKTPEEILMATGWSRAVTGDWKYTLVAPMSTLNVSKLTKVTQGNSESLPLGVLLDYPKLYEAYPQLKGYEVIFQNNPADISVGTSSGEIITINLANIPTLYQMNMVLQHELQHAVQNIEGWQMGGSPDTVRAASTLDVLNSIADKMRESGMNVSDLAVKEADRLMQEFGSQLKGASYNDFQGLVKLIQENLWDAVHPAFSDDLVKEFTSKFDMGLSNQVISLLEQASNDGLYVSLYGEIEARNAERRDFRSVNRLLSSLMMNPELLSAYTQAGKEELVKGYLEELNKTNADYRGFVETAKAALAEISQNEALTQRQKDILNGTFGTTQDREFGSIDKSKIDSVPFDIILLYSELEKNPEFSKEQLETLLNVIQIRSEYARTSASLKNKIVSNSNILSGITDENMLDGMNPLFYSQYGKTDVVPAQKYNPEAFRVTQKEWEAKKKELDDAANAVQNFDPTGEKFKENQDNAGMYGDAFFQGNRGAAFITQDATDLIVALTDPNLSTPLHEIAHIYEKYMTDAEKKVVLDATGETSWSTNTSEYFARGFERYLYSGNAPTAKMMPLFDKLRTWLMDIYTQLTGSEIDVILNQPMRDLYSAMLGEAKAPETEVTPTGGPQTADAALADFISNKRQQGISDDQIYVGLLQSGFKAADLEDFFNLETRKTVAGQIEENGPMKDEARIAADEAAGLYVRRTAEQLEMEMDGLTIEESQALIDNFSNASNLDAAIANQIQNILEKKARGEDVQKDFETLIATGTNLGRALQAFTRLKNQSGALRARNLINKLKQEGKKIPDAIKNKLLALGDAYDEAKAKMNNAKVAAENNPNGQSPVAGKSNIQYFQQQLQNVQNIGQQFATVAAPYTSEASLSGTFGTLIRGNLLTPTSTIINITSNAVKAVFNVPINLIASGVSELNSFLGGTKGTMRGKDYYKYGWKYGFMTGIRKGTEILKKGNLPETSQGLQIEPGFNGFRSMSEFFGGLVAKYVQGKTDADIAAEYGYSLNEAGKIPRKEKVVKMLEGTFGVPAETFFRLLGSVDAVFRNMAYYSALSEQAKLAGLKDPKDIENFIILNSDYSNTKADQEALRYVYSNNSKPYQFISKIYGTGQGTAGKIWKLGATGVIPYAKIPTNLAIEFAEIMIPDWAILKAGYQTSKIYALNSQIRNTKNPQAKLSLEAQKQDLARKRDELIGRAVVGYALTYAGRWIAESGALSSGAQGEDKKRKDYIYRFERPYSVNLSLLKRYMNGEKSDLWQAGDAIVDYRPLGVFGGILYTSQSERRSTEKEKSKEVANQSVFSVLSDMAFNSNVSETARYLIDQSFVKGLNQALAVVDPRQEGSFERFVSGLMGTLSAAVLPNSLAIYDKANRNYIPEYDSPYTGADKIIYDFMAKVKERWPFDDPNNMIAKVDAFGRPIPQTPIGRNAWFFNAFDVTKFSRGLYDDKDQSWEQLVYQAVKKGDVLTAFPSNPAPVVKSRVGGESYVLSPEDYQKYAIAVGEARRKIVNQFIENADLSQLTDMNSVLNQMTPDNEKPYGYVVLGKILTNLYSAADATLINTERGLIYEARKKMATERPEEFSALLEKEKTNIYSQALDLLYNDPEMSQYLPKTTAKDIFFKKKGNYTENREYLIETPEAEQPAAQQQNVNVMEEFFKQK
jgi:hypothetical protein